MSFRKTSLFIFLILFSSVSFAQFEKLLSQARRYYDKSLLFEAKACYGKILEKDSLNKIANLEMAELLFFDIEDYNASYLYLNRYLKNEKDTSPPFMYALGKCEQYRGDYAASGKHFKRFNEKTKGEGKNELYRDEVQKHLSSLGYLEKNKNKEKKRVKVVNLGNAVNTKYPEYVPVVSENENVLMFTSKRKNELNTSPNDDDERYREDMYISKKNGPNFGSPNVLPALEKETQQLKNSPRNESLISLSPDGKTLFLFKKGAIYSSEFKDGSWSEPKVLDEKIISEAYENHASVTADGNRIFFTSERKGGEGGLDIYYAEKKADGSWNKPVNLGKEINTSSDEESPYITPDGKTLFFSSNGLPGYGAHDIYSCEWNGKKFSAPQNMGIPFNSVADDIFFYPHHDLTEGFLSSNRIGGVGDFDIYRFYYTDRPAFKVYPGQVLPAELKAVVKGVQENIANPAVSDSLLAVLKNNSNVAGVYFRLNDSLVSEDLQVIRTQLKKRKRSLQIELVQNCDTCIYRQAYVTDKTNYTDEYASDHINSASASTVSLAGLAPVYFDYAASTLTDQEKEVLGKNSSILKSAPKTTIIIYGHADSRGSASLNKRLALQRAQVVKACLLSNGVNGKQIKLVVSKGEEEPAINCGDACTEEQYRQNRRVEIKPAP